MGKEFVCPHCGSNDGWIEETAVHGYYITHFSADGKLEGGAYNDGMRYFNDSTKYLCQHCYKGVKAAVLKFKGEEK